jgi:molecular chaperone DnaK (HSP70)
MVSSIVLRKAVQDAEETLNEKIEAAVITVPAYFGEAQRQATFNAAQLAGLKVLRLINEPTAAALSYGINHSEEPGYVLVYDLGGGTFDVTVLAIRPQSLDVVAIAGDPALGGKDFDDAISRYLRSEAEKELGPLLWDATSEADLRQKAETAKRQLSGRIATPVPLKLRRLTPDGVEESVAFRPTLSRDKFEELCSPLLSRTQIITQEVLRRAKLGWDDIRHIVCVGGSSRMPAVRRVLEEMAGRAPLLHDPDECVAKGAALQAALLAGDSDLKPTRVSHVLPRPLGVAALRNGQPVVDHIVPSLTPLPYAGVRHGYTTSVDYQSAVQVPIYEGESTDVEAYAHGPIGAIKLEIHPPRKKGQPKISVEFRCDENGLIMAFARDADSGKESGTTIALLGGLGDVRLQQEASLLAQAIIS